MVRDDYWKTVSCLSYIFAKLSNRKTYIFTLSKPSCTEARCSDNASEKISNVHFNLVKYTHRRENGNFPRCISFLLLLYPARFVKIRHMTSICKTESPAMLNVQTLGLSQKLNVWTICLSWKFYLSWWWLWRVCVAVWCLYIWFVEVAFVEVASVWHKIVLPL
jgi:hypothetical protein